MLDLCFDQDIGVPAGAQAVVRSRRGGTLPRQDTGGAPRASSDPPCSLVQQDNAPVIFSDGSVFNTSAAPTVSVIIKPCAGKNNAWRSSCRQKSRRSYGLVVIAEGPHLGVSSLQSWTLLRRVNLAQIYSSLFARLSSQRAFAAFSDDDAFVSSRSQIMEHRCQISPFPLRERIFIVSIVTAIPWGTSSWRRRKAFSRMISPAISRSVWVVTISSS